MQLWDLYQQTVFLVETDYVQWREFAIVTACNPMGELMSSSQNAQLNAKLVEVLNHKGIEFQRIIGCSPDRCHQEQSFVIQCSRSTALQLCARFRQNAMFWVESDYLWLEPCLLTGVNKCCLESFTARASEVDDINIE